MATNEFDDINFHINLITLAISIIAVLAFILQYKLKGVDTPAIIILATYIFKNAICVFV